MKFYPKEHKYIHKDKQYTSCTALIKQMFPKFNKSRVAKQYAIKNQARKKDVLKKWKIIGTEASTVGTIVHEVAEDLMKGQKHKSVGYYKDKYKLNEGQVFKTKELIEKVKQIIPELPVGYILTEQILWDENSLISGTVDLVVLQDSPVTDSISAPPVCWIMDWKTSRTITRVPFNVMDRDVLGYNIPHANYHHYSMQMAVYQELMQTTPRMRAMLEELGGGDLNTITYKHAIIHIPSKSIIEIPANEIRENLACVKSILERYKS